MLPRSSYYCAVCGRMPSKEDYARPGVTSAPVCRHRGDERLGPGRVCATLPGPTPRAIFSEAVADFSRAASALHIAWEAVLTAEEGADPISDADLPDGVEYPFPESFDETILRISAWSDGVRAALLEGSVPA